jgi:hypothetical protein
MAAAEILTLASNIKTPFKPSCLPTSPPIWLAPTTVLGRVIGSAFDEVTLLTIFTGLRTVNTPFTEFAASTTTSDAAKPKDEMRFC